MKTARDRKVARHLPSTTVKDQFDAVPEFPQIVTSANTMSDEALSMLLPVAVSVLLSADIVAALPSAAVLLSAGMVPSAEAVPVSVVPVSLVVMLPSAVAVASGVPSAGMVPSIVALPSAFTVASDSVGAAALSVANVPVGALVSAADADALLSVDAAEELEAIASPLPIALSRPAEASVCAPISWSAGAKAMNCSQVIIASPVWAAAKTGIAAQDIATALIPLRRVIFILRCSSPDCRQRQLPCEDPMPST